jgi:hypothetical protein
VGKSVRRDGSDFVGLPAAQSHAIINAYALAFFDKYLRGLEDEAGWLEQAHYGVDVLLHESKSAAQAHVEEGRDDKDQKAKGFIG